ncbi:penicillin-binding protein 1A [Lactobacillus nasalidis]|uniref:Penicillin-binding protein 1A n=1 Tax=Lactobacillus nasalidis TaxID=2797258 RepID=A0ABQ3W7S4_9LACO|nr:PBP1A family penicillin-binding protein [Lactobacillus nasalidis]GHV97745.1 penicillin-binding protein 1A [Lactobacillus nasalidis]GHW01149.1 penicillin-binding protein 1A [Lactobacillus nasalidis]
MATNNSEQKNTRMSRLHANDGRKKARPVLRVIKWLFLLFVLLLVSGVGVFAFYAKDAPSISTAKLQSGGTSSFYTTDGKFLMSLGSQTRVYVKSKDIPQTLKDAVVSIEDKRFYSEGLGIDPARIISSFLTNVKSSSTVAGGSTITQQLVKLTCFSTASSQRTLSRKAQEAWLAMKVEREYSKDQILEFYINKVYMNYGTYGMGTAANYYYGKSLKNLDLAQLALLAGMPNAPVAYNPYLYPKKAKYRRDLVLKAMYDNKKITKKQYLAAKAESVQKGLKKHSSSSESKLRKVDDAYIKEAIAEVQADGYDPYNDNLKITLNINQAAQNKLYSLANSGSVAFTSKKMQIGATIVNPKNGHVIAILGGRNLPSVQLGLDRAVQTGRSTGSTIKPVLDYAPAIEYLNWGTSHILQDTKYTYPGTNVQLYDWDNTYMGSMSMRYALVQSRNVPAVRTLNEVGISRASLFARKLGVSVSANAGLSTAIGANASSLQMAAAYGAFATMGIYRKPRFVSKIETADGQVRKYNSSGTRVMKKSTAYMITDMLKGVFTSGTGTSAKVSGVYEAGKTGTVKYSDSDLVKYPSYSSTPKDSWFVGYTKQYSIGIWTGYDNLKDGTISGVGQYSAQLIYKYMMTYLMQNKTSSDWTKPSTVVKKRIVKNTEDEVASPGQSYSWELFVKGHAPTDADYTSSSTSTNANSSSTVTSSLVQSSSSSSSKSSSSSSSVSSSSSSSRSISSSSSSAVSAQSSSSSSEEKTADTDAAGGKQNN